MSFISNLFSSPKINYTPPSFSGGGINATFGGGGYNLTPGSDRTTAVGQVASTFGQQAGALGQLRQTVAPGFSQLRQAQLSDLSNQQSSLMSNLRDNLAQRRILGSSFAQDSLSRADAQFEQQRQDTIAKSYLAELEASNQLIQEQYTAGVNQFKTGLDELNLEAGMGAQLTQQASSAMANVAMQQAKLDAENAAGIGKFFGTVAGIGLAPFTGGASLALAGLGSGGMGLPGGSATGGLY